MDFNYQIDRAPKDVLYNYGKLSTPPSRSNSKCCRAAEVHIQDIMDNMVRLDVKDYV